jgi:hypothetical protein
MTTISTNLLIYCPYVRARAYLHEDIERALGDALPQIVRLDAVLPATHAHLSKIVRVTYAPAVDQMHFDEPWQVRWTPEPGGIYPSFEGEIRVRADENYEWAVLELTGKYTPPLGAAGQVFDALAGRQIAEATARSLLTSIAAKMEARYLHEEGAKQKYAAT